MINSPHSPLHPTFRHRENQDGSWDSICMRCYLTAAHSYDEQPLARVESGHHCDETSWLFKESAAIHLPCVSQTQRVERLASPGRTCPASAMPRFSHEPEHVQFGKPNLPWRHAVWPSGTAAEVSSGF
jgi:hypothetical protein